MMGVRPFRRLFRFFFFCLRTCYCSSFDSCIVSSNVGRAAGRGEDPAVFIPACFLLRMASKNSPVSVGVRPVRGIPSHLRMMLAVREPRRRCFARRSRWSMATDMHLKLLLLLLLLMLPPSRQLLSYFLLNSQTTTTTHHTNESFRRRAGRDEQMQLTRSEQPKNESSRVFISTAALRGTQFFSSSSKNVGKYIYIYI